VASRPINVTVEPAQVTIEAPKAATTTLVYDEDGRVTRIDEG
jgi:hypothetical protein